MENIIFKQQGRSNNSICEDFIDIAVKTWNLMGNSFGYDFPIGEETITDINLLELKMRQPNRIVIQKFNKIEEGKNGADWIWIIVGRNGTTFILYVQAKRLFASMEYESILHKGNNPAEQLDKLIFNRFNYTLGLPVYPIYVFYNSFPNTPKEYTCNCGQLLFKKLLGCTYADAFSIRTEIMQRHTHIKYYNQYQYAWSCLVCCNGKGEPRDKHEDLATSFFNRIVGSRRINETDFKDIGLNDGTPFNVESYLLKEPPSFVKQMLLGEKIKSNPFEKLNIGTIIILKESDE